MYCRKCGVINNEDADFCSLCYFDLSSTTGSNPEPKIIIDESTQEKQSSFGVISIILTIIGAVGFELNGRLRVDNYANVPLFIGQLIFFGLIIIGIGLGISGLYQKDKKKDLAAIGIFVGCGSIVAFLLMGLVIVFVMFYAIRAHP